MRCNRQRESVLRFYLYYTTPKSPQDVSRKKIFQNAGEILGSTVRSRSERDFWNFAPRFLRVLGPMTSTCDSQVLYFQVFRGQTRVEGWVKEQTLRLTS